MNISLRKESALAVGRPPRADLLPPEVGLVARARSLRQGLVAIVVLVGLITGAGYAGAASLAADSRQKLDAANARTQELLAEQARYAEVREVSGMLAVAAAARRVGTSTEIDWKAYSAEVQASLPAGTTVTNFSADTATPMSAYAAPTVPLQGDRIGELSFTAVSKSLPDVEAWLNALSKLTGFVDAAPGSVILDTGSDETKAGTYSVTITMHINSDALANRFADEEEK